MRALASFFATLPLLLPLEPAAAWERETGWSGPQLKGHLPADLAITAVQVSMRGDQISVRYFGRPASLRSKVRLWVHTGPAEWQGVATEYPDPLFGELQLYVDGTPQRQQTRVVAWLDGRDVTQDLRRRQVDPLWNTVRESALEQRMTMLGPQARSFFSTPGRGAWGYPLWATSIIRTWSLFVTARPGETSATVEVRYADRPSRDVLSLKSKQFESLVTGHCGDPGTVISRLKQIDPSVSDIQIRVSRIPTRLGDMAPLSSLLNVSATPGEANLYLACGPEEAPIGGSASIDGQQTATGAEISVLRISAVQ